MLYVNYYRLWKEEFSNTLAFIHALILVIHMKSIKLLYSAAQMVFVIWINLHSIVDKARLKSEVELQLPTSLHPLLQQLRFLVSVTDASCDHAANHWFHLPSTSIVMWRWADRKAVFSLRQTGEVYALPHSPFPLTPFVPSIDSSKSNTDSCQRLIDSRSLNLHEFEATLRLSPSPSISLSQLYTQTFVFLPIDALSSVKIQRATAL